MTDELPPSYVGYPDPWEKRRKQYESPKRSAVPDPDEPRSDDGEVPVLPKADPNLIDTVIM